MGSVETVVSIVIGILVFGGVIAGVTSVLSESQTSYGNNWLSDGAGDIMNNLTGYHLDQTKGDLNPTINAVYEKSYNDTNAVQDGQDAEGDYLIRSVSAQKEFFNVNSNWKGVITGATNVLGKIVPDWVWVIASMAMVTVLLGATISFFRSGR